MKRKQQEAIEKITQANSELIKKLKVSKPEMLPMIGMAIGVAAGVAIEMRKHLGEDLK
jgi:hypothetical protein